MKLPKPFLISLIIFLLFLAITSYLGFLLYKQRKVDVGQTPAPEQGKQRSLENEASFDTTNYVIPLESNAVGGFFSSRAQLRGVIETLEESRMVVKIGEELYEVDLPSRVYLKCMPETFTGSEGTVPASQIFLDFRQSEDKGTLISSSEIGELISVGDDVTVQVDVDENDKMTADMIVGYGCRLFK